MVDCFPKKTPTQHNDAIIISNATVIFKFSVIVKVVHLSVKPTRVAHVIENVPNVNSNIENI